MASLPNTMGVGSTKALQQNMDALMGQVADLYNKYNGIVGNFEDLSGFVEYINSNSGGGGSAGFVSLAKWGTD